MTTTTRKALFWARRLLCIAYIVFLSLFALDVFRELHGFRQTTAGLLIHLVPSTARAGEEINFAKVAPSPWPPTVR
jgi:hypothetical protein